MESKRKFASIFLIPKNIKLKNISEETKEQYKYFYIKKADKNISQKDFEKRRKIYLDTSKQVEYFYEKPKDYSKDNYRELICLFDGWYKKCLNKLNKELSKLLYHKENNKYVYEYDYLYSAVKGKSFILNADKHKNNNYIITLDIANFFPSIKAKSVYYFFHHDLQLSSDLAKMCTDLCTLESENKARVLSQGLPTSTTLSFLTNIRLFEEINNLSKIYEYTMTVYVDDVVFSSKELIEDEFINKLFSIFKKYGYSIRKKFHKYGKYTRKKITGLNLNSKHIVTINKYKYEEIMVQYQYLKENSNVIFNEKDEDLIKLYRKFVGNIIYLKEVENFKNKEIDDFINKTKDKIKKNG